MKIEDLTDGEIMHFILLFCYNWTKEDFEIAFKDSRLGWDYYYNRLQGKFQAGTEPTTAIVEVLLNIDNTHRPMLIDYLFTTKYLNVIKTKRENHDLIQKHLNKHEQLRKNKNNGTD